MKKRKLPSGVREVAGRELYQGRIVVRYRNGTKKREVVYGSTVAEVQDHMARLRVKSKATSAPGSITVGEFLDQWLEDVKPLDGIAPVRPRVRMNTYLTRETAVAKRLKPSLGELKLSDLSRKAVGDAFKQMEIAEKGASPRARQVAFETLRAACNAAIDAELLDVNPCLRNRPGHRKLEPYRLSESEQFKLLEAAEKIGHLGLFQLALATGIRRGELGALYKTDFDPVEGSIRIDHTLEEQANQKCAVRGRKPRNVVRAAPKTDESRRTVPLDPVTRAVLNKHLKADKDGGPYLFSGSDGRPYGRDGALRGIFRKVLEDAGLSGKRGLTFHSLRHTARTTMASEGVNPIVAEAILGHRVPGIVGTYTGRTAKMDADYKARMGAFFTRRGLQRGLPSLQKSNRKNKQAA